MMHSNHESYEHDPELELELELELERELEQIWQRLDDLPPPPEVSGQFEARVWARLAEASDTDSQGAPIWVHQLSRFFEWCPVPALGLLVIVMGVFWTAEPAEDLALQPRRLPLERSVSFARQFPVDTADLLNIIIRYQRS